MNQNDEIVKKYLDNHNVFSISYVGFPTGYEIHCVTLYQERDFPTIIFQDGVKDEILRYYKDYQTTVIFTPFHRLTSIGSIKLESFVRILEEYYGKKVIFLEERFKKYKSLDEFLN